DLTHERKVVIERPRRATKSLARTQRIAQESLELLGVGDEIAVRQRRAFGEPGGPAGVLQEQQIVTGKRHRLKVEFGAGGQRTGKRHRVCKPWVQCGTGKLGADAVARPDIDDLPYAGLADDFGERARDAIEDDDGLDASIVELVLEFARRIKRIDVNLHAAGANYADHGERERWDVGQHHGDAVALFHSEFALQISREIAR